MGNRTFCISLKNVFIFVEIINWFTVTGPKELLVNPPRGEPGHYLNPEGRFPRQGLLVPSLVLN